MGIGETMKPHDPDNLQVLNAHHWRGHTGTMYPLPPNSVYVGRPSKWGNPFVIDKDHTRDAVIQAYEKWLMAQPDLLLCLRTELRGKDLVCWCAPSRCHADILLELANE